MHRAHPRGPPSPGENLNRVVACRCADHLRLGGRCAAVQLLIEPAPRDPSPDPSAGLQRPGRSRRRPGAGVRLAATAVLDGAVTGADAAPAKPNAPGRGSAPAVGRLRRRSRGRLRRRPRRRHEQGLPGRQRGEQAQRDHRDNRGDQARRCGQPRTVERDREAVHSTGGPAAAGRAACPRRRRRVRPARGGACCSAARSAPAHSVRDDGPARTGRARPPGPRPRRRTTRGRCGEREPPGSGLRIAVHLPPSRPHTRAAASSAVGVRGPRNSAVADRIGPVRVVGGEQPAPRCRHRVRRRGPLLTERAIQPDSLTAGRTPHGGAPGVPASRIDDR